MGDRINKQRKVELTQFATELTALCQKYRVGLSEEYNRKTGFPGVRAHELAQGNECYATVQVGTSKCWITFLIAESQ